MLTSGQMASEFQKNYIRQNRNLRDRRENDSLPKSYTPDNSSKITASKQPQIREEPFKIVGKDLKLNQSAMIPDKSHIANQKLEDLADKSDSVLLKVSTVFPFTLFTHDIIVDPYKVNVVFREFFYSEHIHSIMIKDILDVVIETSLFFATVKIVDQGYIENCINISYLKKDDALKLRKIIQGLIIAHRQAVDLSSLNPDHIKEKAEELGQIKTIDDSNKKLKSL